MKAEKEAKEKEKRFRESSQKLEKEAIENEKN